VTLLTTLSPNGAREVGRLNPGGAEQVHRTNLQIRLNADRR